MSIIKARCIDQTLEITNAPLIASGDVGTDVIQFEFCSRWDGYGKTAIFYRSEEEAYSAPIINGEAAVPSEVMRDEGFFFFGVYGSQDEKVLTSQVQRYRVAKGALTEDTLTPEDPSPDVYSQIMTSMDRIMNTYPYLEATDTEYEYGGI